MRSLCLTGLALQERTFALLLATKIQQKSRLGKIRDGCEITQQKLVVRRNRGLRCGRHDVNASARLIELHLAIGQSEKCPITACADIVTGHELGAALADNDAARGDEFPPERFNSKTLAVAVPPVAAAALTFLMCHKFLNFDFLDLQHRLFLAVPNRAVITLAPLHLESDQLRSATMFNDIRHDAGLRHIRRA